MDLKDISTQLLFTTVPIWTQGENDAVSSATAFIYNIPTSEKPNASIPLLVTNRHVVSGARRGVIEFIERKGDSPATDRRVRVELHPPALTAHVSEKLDVAAVPMGAVLNHLQDSGRPAFFRSITPEFVPSKAVLDDLAAMEDVVFIGYPSGLRDEKNATPIIRRGITATPVWNDFGGSPCFPIDAGVFPGSSGSPVFILNRGAYPTREGLTVGSRLLFLGIITGTIVRPSRDGENAGVYLGLGKATRSVELALFLRNVADKLRSA